MHYRHALYLGLCSLLLIRGTSTWQVPPREIMAEITNELGVCVLQILGENSRENVAFSPYGLMSVVFLLYEGSNGKTAVEIYNSLRLPWDRHMARVGFKDLHTHIKSYFTNDRFLRGLVLSKPSVPLKMEYVRLLHYYGFYPGPDGSTTTLPPDGRERPGEYSPSPGDYSPSPGDYSPTPGGEYSPEPEEDDNSRPGDYSPTPGYPRPPGYTPSPSYPSFSSNQPNPPTPGDLFPISPSEPPIPSPDPEYSTESSPTDSEYTGLFSSTHTSPVDNESTKRPPPEQTSPFAPDVSDLFGNEEESKESSPTSPLTTTPQPTTKSTQEEPTSREEPTTTSTTTTTTEAPAPDEEESKQSDVTHPAEDEEEKMPLDIDIRFGSTTKDATTTPAPTEKPATTEKAETTPNAQEVSSPANEEKGEGREQSEVVTTLAPPPVTTEDTSSNVIQDSDGGQVEGREDVDTPTTQAPMSPTETIKKLITVLEEKITTHMPTMKSDEELTTVINEISGKTEAPMDKKVEPDEKSEESPSTEESQSESSSTESSTESAVTLDPGDTANTTMSDEPTPETPSPERRRRRRRRYIPSSQLPVEHRDNVNWSPHPDGPHWVYNVPRDQWFYTYSGGVPVQVLTYTDFLPFAYLEPLNSVAIQLPLDDVRYSMLVLLPVERYGLPQLLGSLHQCPIEQILRSLKVVPVHAVIPAFTVVKHINLVPPLTHTGIESLFDAARADLSGMADEGPLFVRSIEQLVTVSLRKYHYSSRSYDHPAANEVRHNFIANHPFIYFVLDTETSAALMAGTITDPVAYKQQSPP